MRAPQSAQSFPYAQAVPSESGPPSSQKPLEVKSKKPLRRQLLTHIWGSKGGGGLGGGDGGGGEGGGEGGGDGGGGEGGGGEGGK